MFHPDWVYWLICWIFVLRFIISYFYCNYRFFFLTPHRPYSSTDLNLTHWGWFPMENYAIFKYCWLNFETLLVQLILEPLSQVLTYTVTFSPGLKRCFGVYSIRLQQSGYFNRFLQPRAVISGHIHVIINKKPRNRFSEDTFFLLVREWLLKSLTCGSR